MRERFCRFEINILNLNDKQVSVADSFIKNFEITIIVWPLDLRYFEWRRFESRIFKFFQCIKIRLKYLRTFMQF